MGNMCRTFVFSTTVILAPSTSEAEKAQRKEEQDRAAIDLFGIGINHIHGKPQCDGKLFNSDEFYYRRNHILRGPQPATLVAFGLHRKASG